MPEANELTAHSYTVDSIGKLFSDSKTRHTWTMDIDGETAILSVTASWNTSKFVVEVNGYERFHQKVSGPFTYSFRFRERFFKLQQVGDTFSLTIDTIPFSQFTARAKTAQAAMLQSYASRAVRAAPSLSRSPADESLSESSESRVSSKQPFGGNLAARLGKDKPQHGNYVSQEDVEDEEDFFAGEVHVESYVSGGGEGVILPNLIDFSTPAAETTPVLGPVTPRDQISPSKLENPFAAANPFASI
jgi:hypothetical protein